MMSFQFTLGFFVGCSIQRTCRRMDVLRSQGFLLGQRLVFFNAANGSLKPRIDHTNYISESR